MSETGPEDEDDAPLGGLRPLIRGLAPWVRRYPGPLVGGLGGLLATSLIDLVPPLLYGPLLDEVIPERDTTRLLWIFGAILACLAVQWLLAANRAWCFGQLSGRVGADLRRALVDRVQSIDLRDPRTRQSAPLLALFGADVEAIETAVLIEMPRAILGSLGTVAGMLVVLVIDWRLTLLVLLAFPLTGVVSWLLSGRTRTAQNMRGDDRAALQIGLDDIVRGQRTIRAFGLSGWWRTRFAGQAGRLEKSTIRLGSLTIGLQAGTMMGAWTFELLVMIGATAMVFAEWLTLGGLLGFIVLLGLITTGVTETSESTAGLVRGGEALERLEALLSVEPPVDEGRTAPALQDAIALDGVRLSFGERTVLDGLDVRFPRGRTVAIVGPSGAGKSTVLNVLLGFAVPQDGRILWDDHDTRDYSLQSLRARMAAVFQDTHVFAMTVGENIRVGRPDATDEEVRAAARDAELDEVIEALPEGYETRLGEGHTQLSGGQRQRLGIARAILRSPEVLVLDEATSALDPATEAEINATLARLGRERTVLSVTHRLESARTADLICVLRDGRLAEWGAHDELIAERGLYAELYERRGAVRVDHGEAKIDPALLARVPLLSGLPDAVYAELANAFVTERFRAGDVVIQAGEAGDRFYVVARGVLGVHAPQSRGGQRVGTLRDADVFGEVALLVDAPRSATVTAEAETWVLSLGRPEFQALIDAYPDARAQIVAEAHRRLEAISLLAST